MGDMEACIPWDGMYMSPEEQDVVWDHNKGLSVSAIAANNNMSIDDVRAILIDMKELYGDK